MSERFKYLRLRDTDFGRIVECRFNVRDEDDSHYTCIYTCLKAVDCPRCAARLTGRGPDDEMYLNVDDFEMPEPPPLTEAEEEQYANFLRERR